MALAEAMQPDRDKHYNARERRIKSVAEPEDETDAANKKWVVARLAEQRSDLEALVVQLREQTNRLVGVIMSQVDDRIKGAGVGEGVTEVSQDERDRYIVAKKRRR